MALPAVKHLDPVVGIDVHSVLVTPGTPPVFLPHPYVGFMLDRREYIDAALGVIGSIVFTFTPVGKEAEAGLKWAKKQAKAELMSDPLIAEGVKLGKEAAPVAGEIASAVGAGVGMGSMMGRPIFVNGFLRATAGTHSFHVPGLHFPLGESFAPPPEDFEPSNDGESYMGSRTVLANNDPMSFMALPAMSCWSIGIEPPQHNGAHTKRTALSMPSSVMLPIPVGRPVLVGGPPVMNMAALASSLFKAFRGSDWAKALADKLHLEPGFFRCNVLGADPVNMITGEVVMHQHDFTVSGRLPLVWERHYGSHDTRCGAVGVGWQTPADIRLELMRHEGSVGVAAHFAGPATAFDALPSADGWPARVYDWQCGHALYRREDRLVLRTRARIEYEFALPPHWQHALERLAEDTTLTLPIGRMADLNGNGWVFEHGPDGGVARLAEWKGEEATGRVIECEAGAGSRAEGRASLLTALRLIDVGGRTHPLVGYEHDRNGNLITALDAMSQPHHFAYADGHRMVSHTSARGISFYYSHRRHNDGVWRVDHAWGDNGLLDYRFIYDIEQRETRITDSLGHTTILLANERGSPVTHIDPLGGVWSYRYDAQGRTSTKTDPAGRTTTWQYDAYGNLLAQTLPDGSCVRAEYNENLLPVCASAPGNQRWQYVWDEFGNLLEQTSPTQATMRYAYDRHGQLVAYTGSGGAVTRFYYDRDGNLEIVIDALGRCTRYTRDTRANLIQAVNALGQLSRYEYDRNGNLTRAIGPGGREVFYSYDASGNLVRYRDAAGNSTQLAYSALGQISKRQTPDGNVVEYRYDTEDQLVGVVNECGELYQLKRDGLGRIVEEVDYWSQTRRYEYGPMGELRRSIDPLGQAIVYQTDTLGRVVQKQVPDPRQPDGIRTETFSYDRLGQLTVAANPDSRVELRYDDAGRLVEEQQGDDFVIAYRYDAVDQRIERSTQLKTGSATVAHTVRYNYDALGAVASMRIDDTVPISLERDVLGRVCVEHLGGTMRREFAYMPEGQLARQTLLAGTGPVFATEYAYDSNGEMTGKRDSRLGFERFDYDPVGKLTGHLDPTGKLHRFLNDPAGDLLKTHVRQGRWAGVLDHVPKTETWLREGEHDGNHYTFDRVGNLVRKQGAQQDLQLRWDGDGLLIETLTVRPAAGPVSGTLRIHTRYEYDVFHRRTRKITQIQRDPGTRTSPAYDRKHGVRTCCFFWEGDALVGEIVRGHDHVHGLLSGATADANFDPAKHIADVSPRFADEHCKMREWVYWPGTFRPLMEMQSTHQEQAMPPSLSMQVSETQHFFFHADPNGAVTRVTDRWGVLIWEGQYAAWGNVKSTRILPGFDQPLRFQGQYFDFEIGLCYNRYRYYDPDIGSFVSRDPIGLLGGFNLYRYAPSPSGWIDPYGLQSEEEKIIRWFVQHVPPRITAIYKAPGWGLFSLGTGWEPFQAKGNIHVEDYGAEELINSGLPAGVVAVNVLGGPCSYKCVPNISGALGKNQDMWVVFWLPSAEKIFKNEIDTQLLSVLLSDPELYQEGAASFSDTLVSLLSHHVGVGHYHGQKPGFYSEFTYLQGHIRDRGCSFPGPEINDV
ncbi:RHS repeat-associated core domain-containing protein [Burkholderia ubonensis]|uniref:RHS repeat-associated core domain-containing protein n=1 Tax=Burkholderia ubonensis TaxID=101571 RepID=UPI00075969FA|nr:RHS repeat-associated core domain-containing protein [Burkholderia ubonensis]KUZ74816.1 type IV secretion protein Rhs [Burkholderia ubonensis]